MAMGMFTTILVACYLIFATQQQRADIKNNQEQTNNLLKGLSCILLILPEDRTELKVRQCIEVNADGKPINYEFFFKQLEENQTMRTDPDFIELVKSELKGERGATGATGESGQDGVDGKDSVSTVKIVEAVKPLEGIKGDMGEAGREVEFQYNTLKSRIEWRYIGDTFWTSLVDACELTNTCP